MNKNVSENASLIIHHPLLSGVYARGSKRSHAGKWKKPVMDSLTLEKNTLKNQEDQHLK